MAKRRKKREFVERSEIIKDIRREFDVFFRSECFDSDRMIQNVVNKVCAVIDRHPASDVVEVRVGQKKINKTPANSRKVS